MTLKEFEDEFYPKMSKTNLSEMFGVSISVHSKILHNEYSDSSDEWYKVFDYLGEHYNVYLIKDRKIYELKREYDEIIEKKDDRIAKLEAKIKDLEAKNRAYVQIDKAVEYLAGHRVRRPKGRPSNDATRQ